MPLTADDLPQHCSNFIHLRTRWTRRILNCIDENTTTGPDFLPGRILKRCATALAFPITALVRFIIQVCMWPSLWKLHWMLPLHKKKKKSDPLNYRGIHITSILSKVAERLIGIPLLTFFDAVDGYGISQWAFRKKHSAQDLIGLLICTWLLAMRQRKKIGIFLSDIQGAFDFVDSNRLIAKLELLGLSGKLLGFVKSFLAPRVAKIIVQGSFSREISLTNMVFQGTVLGPPMWNTFLRMFRTDWRGLITRRPNMRTICRCLNYLMLRF